MKLRILYLINSLIMLVFALALLLMTPVVLKLFGMDNTPDARTLLQLISVGLVVGGMITLVARNSTDPGLISAINISNLIANVLGVVIALNAKLTGVLDDFGWVLVLIYLLLALGFGYFQFLAPPE
jgi:hypothetical protein